MDMAPVREAVQQYKFRVGSRLAKSVHPSSPFPPLGDKLFAMYKLNLLDIESERYRDWEVTFTSLYITTSSRC